MTRELSAGRFAVGLVALVLLVVVWVVRFVLLGVVAVVLLLVLAVVSPRRAVKTSWWTVRVVWNSMRAGLRQATRKLRAGTS